MIMGYSETIMNDPNMDPAFHDKFIKIIYNSSNRLNVLINDILQLHKLEMQQDNIVVEEPTVVEDLKEEILSYYGEGGDKKISVSSDETKEIHISREHFMSIVTNLIDNAMKYSTGKNIHLEINNNNGYVCIAVDDEGPVIPINEQDRIFERFYTTDKSKNQNETGTGLGGLSIVKHIATLYNGDARVVQNKKRRQYFRHQNQRKTTNIRS